MNYHNCGNIFISSYNNNLLLDILFFISILYNIYLLYISTYILLVLFVYSQDSWKKKGFFFGH